MTYRPSESARCDRRVDGDDHVVLIAAADAQRQLRVRVLEVDAESTSATFDRRRRRVTRRLGAILTIAVEAILTDARFKTINY